MARSRARAARARARVLESQFKRMLYPGIVLEYRTPVLEYPGEYGTNKQTAITLFEKS